MTYIPLNKLNESMTADPFAMQEADRVLLRQIEDIAEKIRSTAGEKPVILLSGPSGSGKTSVSYLIERYLDTHDAQTHTISLDHFFRTLTPAERESYDAGKLNLESPDRVDAQYLNSVLKSIVEGKPTWMPRYDFVSTTRYDRDWQLTRKPGELLILEGIHALNPDVVTIPDEHTVRIYVSVRTRITVEEEQITLHPSMLRLLRRILRDRSFRKRSPEETIAMFERVQGGEKRNIQPFKKRATHSIDTFLPYEPGIYKSMLMQTGTTDILSHGPLRDFSRIFDKIEALPPEHVPEDSIVREFIGNSSFTY